MATPMNSLEFARFVLPILRKEWDQRLQNPTMQSPLAQFFGMESSTSSVEYSQGIGSFGLIPEYNSNTAEGPSGTIEYDSFDPLYETTFTHKEYAKGVAIERKLFDDNRTGVIRRKASSLGQAFAATIATHQSSVLNNAFSASFVGGDAVALCSTAHPINSVSASTYSNDGSTALSYDAVITTLIAGQDMNDDRSVPMPSIYDVLYVPTALQGTAYEIVNAIAKPGGANNDANALQFINPRPLQVVVDPYLTDANNWFMIDSQASADHLLWFWRVNPELALDANSDFNLVAKYRGYMRASFGWDDARWIYGHEVA